MNRIHIYLYYYNFTDGVGVGSGRGWVGIGSGRVGSGSGYSTELRLCLICNDDTNTNGQSSISDEFVQVDDPVCANVGPGGCPSRHGPFSFANRLAEIVSVEQEVRMMDQNRRLRMQRRRWRSGVLIGTVSRSPFCEEVAANIRCSREFTDECPICDKKLCRLHTVIFFGSKRCSRCWSQIFTGAAHLAFRPDAWEQFMGAPHHDEEEDEG